MPETWIHRPGLEIPQCLVLIVVVHTRTAGNEIFIAVVVTLTRRQNRVRGHWSSWFR